MEIGKLPVKNGKIFKYYKKIFISLKYNILIVIPYHDYRQILSETA